MRDKYNRITPDFEAWKKLGWNEETKSYKYKDWEWIVLDI